MWAHKCFGGALVAFKREAGQRIWQRRKRLLFASMGWLLLPHVTLTNSPPFCLLASCMPHSFSSFLSCLSSYFCACAHACQLPSLIAGAATTQPFSRLVVCQLRHRVAQTHLLPTVLQARRKAQAACTHTRDPRRRQAARQKSRPSKKEATGIG